MLAFMTYDDEHHRIAIAAVPGLEDKPCHSVGLDHLAYTYANLGDLIYTYERLKQAGIMPVVTINHGPTTSMYYRDPDGNRVELQIDNFDTVEELKGFFHSDAMQKNPIGVELQSRRAGARLSRRRARSRSQAIRRHQGTRSRNDAAADRREPII